MFGFSGINAMNHKSRVRLSEKKLVKDDLAEFHQKKYRDNIFLSSMMLAIHVAPLAVKRVRCDKNVRPIASYMGFLGMGYTLLLYKGVKDYNLAKQGLRWHREIVVE